MSKIAVRLNDDGVVKEVAEYPSSLYQDANKGWITVEDDPAFNLSDMTDWVIRPSDNVLVHKSTNMTPDEENNDALKKLTLQNLQLTKISEDLKTGLTESTKQNLTLAADNIQLKKDNSDMQSAITDLTKEVIGIKAAQAPDTATSTDTDTTTENGGN